MNAVFRRWTQDPQEVADRLRTDRGYLIRTAVYNNFPAVKANWEAVMNEAAPVTPAQMVARLIQEENAGNREEVDQILLVPIDRGADPTLTQAFDALAARVHQHKGAAEAVAGEGDPKWIQAILGIVQIVNGMQQQSEQDAAAQREAERQAAANEHAAQQAAAQAAQRRTLWTWIGAGAGVLIAVAVIIVIRKTSR